MTINFIYKKNSMLINGVAKCDSIFYNTIKSNKMLTKCILGIREKYVNIILNLY